MPVLFFRIAALLTPLQYIIRFSELIPELQKHRFANLTYRSHQRENKMQNPLSRVSDVLDLKAKKTAIHTVTPDATVADTVRTMNQHQVGAVVVVENERVVGIFTERDVLVRIVSAGLVPHETLVARVMTRDPICVTRSQSASDVMKIASEKCCRHFPVVEDDRLIGVISIRDLVKLASRDQASRIDAGILAMKSVGGR